MFWRRRLVALAVLALVVGLAVGAVSGGDGGDASGAAGASDSDEPSVRLTIAASGDLLIHGPVIAQALANGDGRRYEFRPMLTNVRRIVSRADLGICHLEVPLTDSAPQGWPVFRAPADLADAIAWTGWDACSTASNHSVDNGVEGMDFTIRRLDRAHVRHSGTNLSATSQRAAMLSARGVKVALLAYTSMIPGLTPPPEGWRLNMAEPDRILADARAARRAGADVVIVSVHWGDEYVHEPSGFQLDLARRLTASRDVTAVIGQHVHVVQPVRRMNGKPVVFGEGNLLSNQTAACCPVESQDGMVVLLDVLAGPEGSKVTRVRYIPTEVSHPTFEVVRASNESRQRTIGYAGRQPPWLEPVG